ncbi:hypothetical protein ACJX0J_022842, partial [Zea mays]
NGTSVQHSESFTTSPRRTAGGFPPAPTMKLHPEKRGLDSESVTRWKKLGAENRSVSAKKPDAGGLSPAMDKEKEQILFRFPHCPLYIANISTDHKLVMSKPPAVENVADGRAERMEKEKEAKEKREHNHKEHNKTRENSISYLIDSVNLKPSDPPIAPPVDDGKSVVPDENLKKRKNTETNGYLQNNLDMRPTKLPRPALPSNCVEDGTASHVAAPLSSVKQEAINIDFISMIH